jgi:hypothetical protein
MAAQGVLERKQNGRQVPQKMKARIQSGYYTFAAPFGYRYAKFREHGKMLVRDEPKASILQEFLEGYASRQFQNQVDYAQLPQHQARVPKRKKRTGSATRSHSTSGTRSLLWLDQLCTLGPLKGQGAP